jgi:hypothetical protein
MVSLFFGAQTNRLRWNDGSHAIVADEPLCELRVT